MASPVSSAVTGFLQVFLWFIHREIHKCGKCAEAWKEKAAKAGLPGETGDADFAEEGVWRTEDA